jgi:Ankyrin repeats (many copies)
VDEEFLPAAMAIVAGDLTALARLLADDPGLATRRSTVSHPTLLQLVACEEPKILDPIGAVRMLMEAGADTTLPLVAAAGCDARSVLEFMLDAGVDIDGDQRWTPLDESLYWSNMEIAALLLRRGARIRALSTAAGLGDLDEIGDFFESDGLGPNAGPIGSPFPDTIPKDLAMDAESIIDHAFVMAVNNGYREAAEFLVDQGARVSAVPPGYHWKGTALHAGVWRGDRDMVEWLLSLGADPSIRDGLADSDAVGWARHHGHDHLLDLFDSET